jgi:hypothetical protein
VRAENLETSERVIEGAADGNALAGATDCQMIARASVLTPRPSRSDNANQKQYEGSDDSTNAHEL